MIRLEQLQPTALRTILSDQVVTLASVRCFIPEPLKLIYKTLTNLLESDQ